MSRKGTHYSLAFNTESLIALAEESAKILHNIYTNTGSIPVLVYVGFSGITFGAILAVALKDQEIPFEQMYVRKKEELSHGQDVECSVHSFDDDLIYQLVFVDDLVESGRTLKYALKNAIETFEKGRLQPQALLLLQENKLKLTIQTLNQIELDVHLPYVKYEVCTSFQHYGQKPQVVVVAEKLLEDGSILKYLYDNKHHTMSVRKLEMW